ncbi:MAG: competence/damage-inducible protein A [Desulfobacterales bacterium]|nr:competence/damage-inducible protein A [Desulfobacterales bacterium]
MIIEILSTGDEVCSGAVVDSNAAYIAQELKTIGVDVVRHNCAGDEQDRLTVIMREIAHRADAAIVTGGIGPTEDDITALSAANAAGVELEFNQDAQNSIISFFKKRNRDVPFEDNKQAMLPVGSDCIFNPVGTAPGFSVVIDRCRFFFLPGVPSEMKRMMGDSVIPAVRQMLGDDCPFSLLRVMSLFGLPESKVGEMLSGLTDGLEGLKLGLRAQYPVIQVRLYAQGQDEEKLKSNLNIASSRVHDKIGDHIFTDKDESLAAAVGRTLKNKNETIAVAESCTGGLISNLLTDVSGSSGYFLFSGVTYANEAKVKVLNVSQETLESFGAVSEETAKEMARGVRELSGATYGISTSGVAGPDGGTGDKPVGTVCIGLATQNSIKSYRFHFPALSRERNKMIFAMKALDILRRELMRFAD